MNVADLMMKRQSMLGWFGVGALVGGVLMFAASEAKAQKRSTPFRVLFVGNSHLFVNNVPARIRSLLRKRKGAIKIRTFATGGARLDYHRRRSDVSRALKSGRWDVVVLQEATASFLSVDGRKAFHRSLDWFRKRTPKGVPVVLYQTWPWRAGSRYLNGQGINSAGLWSIMRKAYAAAAGRNGVVVAPVGECWMRSPKRNAFYSEDGNHASIAGSALAARVIARTILRVGGRRGGGRC